MYLERKKFRFDVVVMPRWRLWFWWRDWNQCYIKDRYVKQRLWKLQVGRFMFVYWHKRGGFEVPK